jgi:hypothetical protein
VSNESRIGRTVQPVIAAPFAQTETSVDRSAHHVGIAVILPIILPPANLAQFLRLGDEERFISTALTPRSDC